MVVQCLLGTLPGQGGMELGLVPQWEGMLLLQRPEEEHKAVVRHLLVGRILLVVGCIPQVAVGCIAQVVAVEWSVVLLLLQ